jgi:hypothetical protein
MSTSKKPRRPRAPWIQVGRWRVVQVAGWWIVCDRRNRGIGSTRTLDQARELVRRLDEIMREDSGKDRT